MKLFPFTVGYLSVNTSSCHVEAFARTSRSRSSALRQTTTRIHSTKPLPTSQQITEGLTGEEAAAVREQRIKKADEVAVSLGITQEPPNDDRYDSVPPFFASAKNNDDAIRAFISNSNIIAESSTEFNSRDEKGDNVDEMTTITFPQRIRVLAYRTFLITSAMLLAIIAIYETNFFAGTGIDTTYIVESSENVLLPITAGASLLLAPVPKEVANFRNALSIIAIAAAVAGGPDGSDVMLTTARDLGYASLFAVSVREIYYFGLQYKLEALVASLLLPFLSVVNDNTIATPLSALAVGVLAFSKVFEPCREDYFKSNSEFFVDGDDGRSHKNTQ